MNFFPSNITKPLDMILFISQTVEMRVHMDCPGCESKVRSALQKLKGICTPPNWVWCNVFSLIFNFFCLIDNIKKVNYRDERKERDEIVQAEGE